MFSSFRGMVSDLYKEFYEYLGHSLDPLSPGEKAFFESIRLNTASVEYWGPGEEFEMIVWLFGPEIWPRSYGIH